MPTAFRLNAKLTNADVSRVILHYTRRALAQRLRAAGNRTLQAAVNFASSELELRPEERRRVPGSPHYADSFDVTYNNVNEFAAGEMVIQATNRSQNAWRIEYGTSEHDIPVSFNWPGRTGSGPFLAWPGHIHGKGASVRHPGTPAYAIVRRSFSRGLRQSFPSKAGGFAIGGISVEAV